MRNSGLSSLIFLLIASFLLGGFFSLAIANAASIKAGTLLSSFAFDGNPDVFLINKKNFKRYFLNPTVLGFYPTLRSKTIKQVSSQIKDSFVTSNLYRNCNKAGSGVYALEITSAREGILHHIRISRSEALAQDKDFFRKVFCINTKEFTYYRKGSDMTSLDESVALKHQLQRSASVNSLKVISPNGGEFWEAGKTYTIEWIKPARIQFVDIVLLKDGKYLDLLAEKLPGARFDWSIPGGTFLTGKGYKIRIADSNAVGFTGVDLSNDSFTIVDKKLEDSKEYRALTFVGADARRVQDIQTIQDALKKFFGENNNSYPTSLGPLAPKYIDPTSIDVAFYAYKAFPDGCSEVMASSTTACVNYHLGATLEDNSNPVLSQDNDFDSSFARGGFNGSDANPCVSLSTNQVAPQSEPSGFCYDVVGEPQNLPKPLRGR